MITIDDREVTQHPELATIYDTWQLPVRVERLNSADYAFLDRNGNPVGIERCEINNLVQKIRSGELESQLVRCDEDYNTIILLVEGVYDMVEGGLAHYHKRGLNYFLDRVSPFTKYADVRATMIRLSELGIEIIETANFTCTLKVIETLYKQRTKPESQHFMFKKVRQVELPVKLSTNPAVPKLLALCPRMSEKVAIRLIYKYDSIWNILHAEEAELLQVEGMGKGTLANLKKGVGKE